jgi:NADPH-dependent ferric siderophore reductase
MARGTADQTYEAEVLSSSLLTPAMRRIVIGGPGLAGFASTGKSDEWFRLLVPADPEPLGRWYTVRDWDPERVELTVDVVVHEHGAAIRWAEGVQPGDPVSVSAPAGRFELPEGTDWVLVIADQTGVPAAGRILAELPAGLRAHAIVEAPSEAAVIGFETRAELIASWVCNPAPAEISSPLAAATRTFTLPAGVGYVWMAGEAGCARDIRRYFRHELGWRSASYDIVGYWRPDSERYLRRYAKIEQEVAEIWDRGEQQGQDQEATADEIFAVMERNGL